MSMTSVDLPKELIEQAKVATGEHTVRGALISALTEVVTRSRQQDALGRLAQHDFLGDLLDPGIAARAEG